MALLPTYAPTLLDLSRRADSNGKVTQIIEQIEPLQEILQDIPFIEANEGSFHKTTVRTGLPQGTWRLLNYGVQPEKSTTKQVTDTVGMLETYAQVDKALLELNGNSAAWRMSEDKAFLTGMTRNFVSSVFYGDTTVNPERFTGFAPRFNTPSTLDTQSGYNLIDGGAADGQTDTLSIYLVGWGPDTVHGIYGRGLGAGWTATDLPEDTLNDAAGGLFQGYRTHYKWNVGLTVRDWRYVARIVNIDSSALTKDAATGAKLIQLMIDAAERVSDLNGANFRFYVPRKIRAFLRHQILAKTTNQLNWDTVGGRKVMTFDDIPVRRTDALVDETAIPDAAGSFADL